MIQVNADTGEPRINGASPREDLNGKDSESRMVRRLRAVAATLITALLLALPSFAHAAGPEASADETEIGPIFLLSLGGKLYDDLWTVLDQQPPTERNPALAAASRTSARETWRCVTCHGWSYSGATVGRIVFPGFSHLAGEDPARIRERILDPTHPFPAFELPELALELLTRFISEGLYRRADILDDNGHALGNPEVGRDIFEGACINCHQLDGRRFLRGERGDRSSLGWVWCATGPNRRSTRSSTAYRRRRCCRYASFPTRRSQISSPISRSSIRPSNSRECKNLNMREWTMCLALLASGSPPAATQMAEAASGRQLAELWCASCHLVSPEQTKASTEAPSFETIARRSPDELSWLAAFLADPHPPMPQLALTRAEISDLVAYFASLRRPE